MTATAAPRSPSIAHHRDCWPPPRPALAVRARHLALPRLRARHGAREFQAALPAIAARQRLGAAHPGGDDPHLHGDFRAGDAQPRLPGVDDTFAYSLYLCAGILPWLYFTELLSRSLTLFLEHATLLKKVSFPRSTLPVILLLRSTSTSPSSSPSSCSSSPPSAASPAGGARLPAAPRCCSRRFALGLGVLLGVLNVFFRDVAQLVGVALQFWFWLTPIVYSTAILPDRAQRLFALNPMPSWSPPTSASC